MIYIGIDTGTNTGFAVWDGDAKLFIEIKTYKIDQAMQRLSELISYYGITNVQVRVEDARKRKLFKGYNNARLQGAGSIKRDCAIWEDYLKRLHVDFILINPERMKTKINANAFKKITGYTGVTNEHSRDAGMLVFNL